MLNRVLTSVFGSRNERLLKKLDGIVAKVNALEPKLQALSDDELKAKTPEFQQRIRDGESLDEYMNRIERQLILEALAKTGANRTAAARLLGVTFRSLRYRIERLGIEA